MQSRIQSTRSGRILNCRNVRTLRSVILASASPRRRAILSSVGLDVRVVPSRYEERPAEGVAPRVIAALHARGKAMGADLDGAGAELLAGPALIVAADTVVDLDGKALMKPADAAEGRAMLRALAGREHAVHTAFCLRTTEGRTFEHTETTAVRFYPLNDAEIDDYVATGDGADKAGSYGIQGVGAPLVERIAGDFYTVMGFPLGAFVRSLPKLGWTLRLHDAEKAGVA
ncbi:MAG TPA: Maf family protein [Candidatus Acidoferrales bacterium]|nr:Maf family protein [Candidatus Acidoferrales bacterium]